MRQIYEKLAQLYFFSATIVLMILSFLLFVLAIWEVVANVIDGSPVEAVLSSISLLVIGFAVVETAKFIAEEELLRKRELRSSTESRRSLTKFVTIIVIAASLEALVMVFQATRQGLHLVLYPAGLLIAAMFALLCLGAYQWTSSRIQSNPAEEPVREESS
ncbi:MAG: hypothetical protein AB7O39_16075 [Flavobacteriaceae bacterium]